MNEDIKVVEVGDHRIQIGGTRELILGYQPVRCVALGTYYRGTDGYCFSHMSFECARQVGFSSVDIRTTPSKSSTKAGRNEHDRSGP